MLDNIESLNPENENIARLQNQIKLQKKAERAFSELSLDDQKMGILDTINCGRKLESNDFWKTDEVKPGEVKVLTAIVLGPQEQNPRSLAERLALEFLNELDAENQAVFYQRDGTTRRMQPLSIAARTEVLLHNTVDQYLESIVNDRKLTNYSAVVHLVEVNVEASEKILYQVFDMVHQKLADFSKQQEILSLLLMVYRYPATRDADQLNQHLKAKAMEDKQVKYYRITTGAKRQEIINWFNAHRSAQVVDVQTYLDSFMEACLDEESRKTFKEKQILPMQVMERIQNQLFKWAMYENQEPKSP